MCNAISNKLVLMVAIFATSCFITSIAFAEANYNITIDSPTENACFDGPVDVIGTWNVSNNPQGNLIQYNVQIDWGDGEVDEAVNITRNENNKTENKMYWGTYFTNPFYQHSYYTAEGECVPITLVVKLYHSEPPGAESGDAMAMLTILTCNPKIVNDYCYYGGGCSEDPEECCNYLEPVYCPDAGTVEDGYCYYGNNSERCTNDGCIGSAPIDNSTEYCDPETGPEPLNCTPSEEVCDGIDNDCDGETDEGFNVGETCSVGVGECEASGYYVCNAEGTGTVCDAVEGIPSDEVCDNIDNDCDGETDENLTQPTSNQEGLCSGNTEVCVFGNWSSNETNYEPTNETYDGYDNDCDGLVDESTLNDTQSCNSSEECISGNCVLDYDGEGSWCAPAGDCSHDGVIYLDGSIVCFGSNREVCSNSTWSGEFCTYGCTSGACIVPASGGGGGGGGGGIITLSCKENWTCSDWSDCVDGLQTRDCTDENDCNTVKTKPNTTQECAETNGGIIINETNSTNSTDTILPVEEEVVPQTQGPTGFALLLASASWLGAIIAVIIASVVAYWKRKQIKGIFSRYLSSVTSLWK